MPKKSAIDWKALIGAARVARKGAYAPYSKFYVGSAILTSSGEIYTGANVENVTYGLCVCAERVAVSKAVTTGDRKIVACAVITQSHPPSPPCGMCLQTLSEFADDLPIQLVNTSGQRVEARLRDLFPGAFSKALLES